MVNENKNTLNAIDHEVTIFKENSADALRDSIDKAVETYKKTLPDNIDTNEFELKIGDNIEQKLAEFKKDIDINTPALYYSLKTEIELNKDISEKDLTLCAYEFLERTTKNKIFKKILKELKKENKHG